MRFIFIILAVIGLFSTLGFGLSCTKEEEGKQCPNIPNSICRNQTCGCAMGFVFAQLGCVAKNGTNTSCPCQDPNSICVDTLCPCKEGYMKDLTGKCILKDNSGGSTFSPCSNVGCGDCSSKPDCIWCQFSRSCISKNATSFCDGGLMNSTSLKYCECMKIGCGLNQKCTLEGCKCLPDFIPTSTGCIKNVNSSCADTCKIENAFCDSNDRCVCKIGYFPDSESRTCKQLNNTGTESDLIKICSAQTSCGYCTGKIGCFWCESGENSKCIANVASSNQNCSAGFVFSTQPQCDCLKGCGENQECGLQGCRCKLGFYYKDGKCVDASNPCASVTCPLGETCVNQPSREYNNSYIPICTCPINQTRINGVCQEFNQNPCQDSTTCRCAKNSVGSVLCCQSPLFPDVVMMKCRFRCATGEFTDDLMKCICPNGTVNDLITGRCSLICPNGEAPREGRCGFICPSGMGENPKYDPRSNETAEPPCVFFCPDGTRVLYKDACEDRCKIYPTLSCKCEDTTKVRDLKTFECVPPCPGGVQPYDRKCPITNNCGDGAFPFYNQTTGTTSCKKKCYDGSLVLVTETCPKIECSGGQVFDRGALVCASPCADGSIPFNGICAVICKEDPVTCCILATGSAEKCPKPPCPEGEKRNPAGDCVKPCENGFLPTTNGNCSVSIGCPEGYIRRENVCGVFCGALEFKKNSSECCPFGQIYSLKTQRCHCPDGSIALDARCNVPTNPIGVAPCPPPLKRDVNGKCMCPDPIAYPDPFDGRRCGFNPCPNGLVYSDNQCVCPVTNLLPIQVEFDGKNRSICKCDPGKIENCPLTPFNCEGSEFKKCVCLRNKTACEGDDSLSAEGCKAAPNSRECFCKLRPEAVECIRPNPCSLNPNADGCVSISNCTFRNLAEKKCTIEDYCQTRPEAKECACLKPGGCTQSGISFAPGVGFRELIETKCQEIDYKNQTNRACYCLKNYDPFRCFCFINPQDPKCLNPDGNSTIPSATVTINKTCSVISKLEGNAGKLDCRREKIINETKEEIKVQVQEGNNNVVDKVNVDVKKGGNYPGLLRLLRNAVKGSGAPKDSIVNDTNIAVNVRFVISRCFEFMDVDGSNNVTEGDSIIKDFYFRSLNWTINTFTNDQNYTTITFTSNDDIIVVTYVISGERTDFGPSSKPARSTKVTLDVNFPFEERGTKLGCDIKVIVKTPILYKDHILDLDGKAKLAFEKKGSSGNTEIDVSVSGPILSSDEDKELVEETNEKVYTFVLVTHTFNPGHFHYDPDLTTSETAAKTVNMETGPTNAPTTGPTNVPTNSPASPASILSVSIFAVLFYSLISLFDF